MEDTVSCHGYYAEAVGATIWHTSICPTFR